ncbi:probable serine/threonine-protein kinase PBL10 isoform X2 [Euphorbia lathyris]|uniref:probable serine/threonine-protein kinase PBL10 isoform X2 n=1 Tax=Euphorbia lathyris TaxID=212925 RepID=UPI003313DF69
MGVHSDIKRSLTTNKVVSSYAEGSVDTCDGYSKPSPTNKGKSILNESCNDDKELICAPFISTSRAKWQKSDTQQLNFHKQDYMKMYTAFPSNFAEKWLQNLKRLKIAFCDELKVVFWIEENYGTSIPFNSLKELELYGLRNLVHIWFHIPQKITAFQNLQLLVLSECPNLYVFSSRIAKLLAQLQKLYISRCEKMEEIVANDENEIKDKIVLPQLKLLELQHIPNLRIFFGGIYGIELPLLASLKLNQCNKMKAFSYGSLRTPMLERIEINGSLYSSMGGLNATMRRCEGCLHFHCFSFADLKIAANNFRPNNLLDEGSSGNVYSFKGWIDTETFAPSKNGIGMPVAINLLNSECQREWLTKLYILERLSHPNLVTLLGHCCEDRKLLLVYEYMQNGSLEIHLFRRNPAIKPLSWDMRIKIAIGAARGLDFLHSSEYNFHSCLKPSVILLDGNYNAKISAFVWSRLGSSDGEEYGYVAPECIVTGMAAASSMKKQNTYSFGVVLLELMTGLRASDITRPVGQQNLVDWLKPILSQKTKLMRSIIDTRMGGQYPLKAMLLAVQLSLKCLESKAASRPSMKEVVDILEQIEAIGEKQAGH